MQQTDGKPAGHINIGTLARWLIRQQFGAEVGNAIIDLVESFTPQDLKSIRTVAGLIPQIAMFARLKAVGK